METTKGGEWASVEIRVCTVNLLIYKAETSTTRRQGYFFSTALLIYGFQDIAADPVVENSPGLMGYFSTAKIKNI